MQKGINDKKSVDLTVEDMFVAGAHYGYSKSRRHPSVTPYIYATKKGSDIIDIEKSLQMLDTAKEFVTSLGSQNKTLLFVGTKPEARETTKDVAMSLNMPYINARWIGGTLSNFSEIKKRIAELEKYNKESIEGGLEKYTKKERVVLAKKMEKLSKYYTGLLGMKKIPDAIFVVDAKTEAIAVTEARKSGVSVIALANSDTNLKEINYPIVGNDSAIPSIRLFIKEIASAYSKGTTISMGTEK